MKSMLTAFAVLDILGYGALMGSSPDKMLSLIQELRNSYKRYFGVVQRDINRFAHFSGQQSAPVIGSLQFSDTLLIYFSQDDTTITQLKHPKQLIESVCFATSLTLSHFIGAGVPLRGAIGFGPTYISHSPLFFTGMDLYDVFKLERKQAWAGVAIHESAMKIFESDERIHCTVQYPIPFYSATDRIQNRAIDWVSPLCYCDSSGEQAVEPPWGRMFMSSDNRVIRKRNETIKFYETIKTKPNKISVGVAKEAIIKMRERILTLS